MSAYEKLQIAREQERPAATDYIDKLFTEALYLHGDRRFADDPAVVGGIARIGGLPVTFIGIQKGKDLSDRIRCNFGCPKPEGYRKALRLMKQAEKFGRPIICFVDTSGAYCGEDAEERGQGQAIAENLMEMMGLKVPIITVVIGVGGSGGALGLGVADKVYMLENSVYSVISPEGCASILWNDSQYAPRAAEALHITAEDMWALGVSERVIHENFDHFGAMCKDLKEILLEDLHNLMKIPRNERPLNRYNRFRALGKFEEKSTK